MAKAFAPHPLYQGCHELEQPLDWTVSLRLQRRPTRSAGLVPSARRGPVDLTFTHLLWECQFWDSKVEALPAEWLHRLQQDSEPELWNRSRHDPTYLPRTTRGMSPFEGISL